MAVIIDKDGKETVGGIAGIRNAFQEASAGQLTVTQARMRYGAGDSQIIEFVGYYNKDKQGFDVSTEVPAGGALAPAARALAAKLIQGAAT